MSNTAEKIKERLSIQDVVSSYIKLDKAGKNFKANCPFHNEKTPSFFVSPERNSYYCFGCQAKGDIFTFVQEFEGLDFMGALRVLAPRAGVQIETIDPEAKSERERLFSALEEAAKFFEENLLRNDEALKYLKKRGLKESTIKSFRIGFAKDEWRSAYEHLKNKRFTDDELMRAGLIKRAEKGGGERYYDTFRGRIIFPIFDSSGRVIAFSGRAFGTDDPAKYLNTPETKLFDKGATLYGLDRAKGSMRKNNFCILVEGQMDLILSHQAGYSNTLASSGTALTEEHLRRVGQLTKNIVLAFDADSAGVSSVGRGADSGLALGMDVKVARLPNGVDPADLISDSSDKWQRAIREAEHIISFYLNVLSEQKKDERAYGKAVREIVLPYVARIESKIDQEHFIKLVSGRLNVPDEAIREELLRVPAKPTGQTGQTGQSYDSRPQAEEGRVRQGSTSRRGIIERKLLGTLFWQGSLKKPSIDVKKTKERMESAFGDSLNIKSIPKEEKDELAFEAEILLSGVDGLLEHVEEMLLSIEEENLKELFAVLMRDLKEAEGKKDATKALQILKKCQSVSEQLQNTKSKMTFI